MLNFDGKNVEYVGLDENKPIIYFMGSNKEVITYLRLNYESQAFLFAKEIEKDINSNDIKNITPSNFFDYIETMDNRIMDELEKRI